MNSRLLGLLGLCAKAGKIQSGQFLVLKALESGKVGLVLLAKDITYRSRKTLTDQAGFRHAPIVDAGLTQEELGRAVGQANRCAVAVLDAGFASLIQKELSNNHESV